MKHLRAIARLIFALGAIVAALGALCGAALVVYLDWRDRDANANPR